VVLGRVLWLRVVCMRNGCSAAPSGFDTAVPCARQLQCSVQLWESDYVPALARSCDFRTVPDECCTDDPSIAPDRPLPSSDLCPFRTASSLWTTSARLVAAVMARPTRLLLAVAVLLCR